MSANFYHSGGIMIGVDFHDFFTGEPPAPPIPVIVPHGAFAMFDGPLDEESTRLANVTSCTFRMLQKEFKRTWVLHIPPLLPPYVGVELIQYLLIIVQSGSGGFLGVASVTGGGKSLATCIYTEYGVDINCGDPCDSLLNVVHNISSVMTQPTGMDFAEAIFLFATNAIVSILIGKLFDAILGDAFKGWAKGKVREAIHYIVRKFIENDVKDGIGKGIDILKDLLKGGPVDLSEDDGDDDGDDDADDSDPDLDPKIMLGSLGVTHV